MIGATQEPLIQNAADEDEARQAADEQDLAAQQALADVRADLADYDHRRRYIARIGACGVFDPITGTAEVVARKLGRREVGLELLAAAERHPELFAQMWVEHLTRAKETHALRKARRQRDRQGDRR